MNRLLRKLTDDQVREIRSRLKKGESLRSIAKDFPVSHCAIKMIADGYTYRDVTIRRGESANS